VPIVKVPAGTQTCSIPNASVRTWPAVPPSDGTGVGAVAADGATLGTTLGASDAAPVAALVATADGAPAEGAALPADPAQAETSAPTTSVAAARLTQAWIGTG